MPAEIARHARDLAHVDECGAVDLPERVGIDVLGERLLAAGG